VPLPGPIEESKIPPLLDSTDSRSEILLHRGRKPWKFSFKILSSTAEVEVHQILIPRIVSPLFRGMRAISIPGKHLNAIFKPTSPYKKDK